MNPSIVLRKLARDLRKLNEYFSGGAPRPTVLEILPIGASEELTYTIVYMAVSEVIYNAASKIPEVVLTDQEKSRLVEREL